MSSHEESHAADAESLLARTEMGGHETSETKDRQEKVVVEIDPPQKATRAKKSLVWQFFEEVKVPSKKRKGETEIKGKCMACGSLFAKTASGTISHWMRHLNTCDLHKHNQNRSSKRLSIIELKKKRKLKKVKLLKN
ncbi:hypothetical protein ACQ4PT_046630 [Festuca glaucescens]